MNRNYGKPDFGIWLLGDSEPDNWKEKLEYPLDDRHPIVHNIWTSIENKIQDKLFDYNKSRMDTHRLFIRNAVDDSKYKPERNLNNWEEKKELIENIEEYKNLINTYHPKIILSFGAFSFEFCRRCLGEKPKYQYNHWDTKSLGVEFYNRVNSENIESQVKLLPLLHRSISGGKFLESHKNFCQSDDSNDQKYPNYFEYVAKALFNQIKDLKEIMK